MIPAGYKYCMTSTVWYGTVPNDLEYELYCILYSVWYQLVYRVRAVLYVPAGLEYELYCTVLYGRVPAGLE